MVTAVLDSFRFVDTTMLCVNKIKEPEFWRIDEKFAYILGSIFLKESALQ